MTLRNQDAFEDQLLEVYKSLRPYAKYLVWKKYSEATTETPEDLLNSMFMICLEQQSKFDGDNLKAWAAKIMHNQFVSKIRKRAKESLDNEPPEQIAADDPHTKMETKQVLRFIIDEMPENLSQIYMLRGRTFLKGERKLTSSQIGEILGVPAGTIRRRLHEGAKLLDEKFGEGVLS